MAEERSYLDMLTGLMSVFSPGEAEAEVVARDRQAQQLIEAVTSGATMPAGQEADPLVGGRFDPLRKRIYQQVLQAAQARPETVSVGMAKQMPESLKDTAGFYQPDQSAITLREYDPLYASNYRVKYKGPDEKYYQTELPGTSFNATVPTAMNYQEVLAHELLHFLLPQVQRDLLQKGPSKPSRALSEKFQIPYERRVDVGVGNVPAQHAFINYLLGGQDVPIMQGPSGAMQPDLAAMQRRVPFGTEILTFLPVEDIYALALQRILSDPGLRKMALEPLKKPIEGR